MSGNRVQFGATRNKELESGTKLDRCNFGARTLIGARVDKPRPGKKRKKQNKRNKNKLASEVNIKTQ